MSDTKKLFDTAEPLLDALFPSFNDDSMEPSATASTNSTDVFPDRGPVFDWDEFFLQPSDGQADFLPDECANLPGSPLGNVQNEGKGNESELNAGLKLSQPPMSADRDFQDVLSYEELFLLCQTQKKDLKSREQTIKNMQELMMEERDLREKVRKRRDEACAEVERLKREMSTLTLVYQNLLRTNESVEKEVSSNKLMIQQLEAKLQVLKFENKDLQVQVKKGNDAEKIKLKDEVKDQKRLIKKYEREIDEKTVSIRQLRVKLSAAKGKTSEMGCEDDLRYLMSKLHADFLALKKDMSGGLPLVKSKKKGIFYTSDTESDTVRSRSCPSSANSNEDDCDDDLTVSSGSSATSFSPPHAPMDILSDVLFNSEFQKRISAFSSTGKPLHDFEEPKLSNNLTPPYICASTKPENPSITEETEPKTAVVNKLGSSFLKKQNRPPKQTELRSSPMDRGKTVEELSPRLNCPIIGLDGCLSELPETRLKSPPRVRSLFSPVKNPSPKSFKDTFIPVQDPNESIDDSQSELNECLSLGKRRLSDSGICSPVRKRSIKPQTNSITTSPCKSSPVKKGVAKDSTLSESDSSSESSDSEIEEFQNIPVTPTMSEHKEALISQATNPPVLKKQNVSIHDDLTLSSDDNSDNEPENTTLEASENEIPLDTMNTSENGDESSSKNGSVSIYSSGKKSPRKTRGRLKEDIDVPMTLENSTPTVQNDALFQLVPAVTTPIPSQTNKVKLDTVSKSRPNPTTNLRFTRPLRKTSITSSFEIPSRTPTNPTIFKPQQPLTLVVNSFGANNSPAIKRDSSQMENPSHVAYETPSKKSRVSRCESKNASTVIQKSLQDETLLTAMEESRTDICKNVVDSVSVPHVVSKKAVISTTIPTVPPKSTTTSAPTDALKSTTTSTPTVTSKTITSTAASKTTSTPTLASQTSTSKPTGASTTTTAASLVATKAQTTSTSALFAVITESQILCIPTVDVISPVPCSHSNVSKPQILSTPSRTSYVRAMSTTVAPPRSTDFASKHIPVKGTSKSIVTLKEVSTPKSPVVKETRKLSARDKIRSTMEIIAVGSGENICDKKRLEIYAQKTSERLKAEKLTGPAVNSGGLNLLNSDLRASMLTPVVGNAMFAGKQVRTPATSNRNTAFRMTNGKTPDNSQPDKIDGNSNVEESSWRTSSKSSYVNPKLEKQVSTINDEYEKLVPATSDNEKESQRASENTKGARKSERPVVEFTMSTRRTPGRGNSVNLDPVVVKPVAVNNSRATLMKRLGIKCPGVTMDNRPKKTLTKKADCAKEISMPVLTAVNPSDDCDPKPNPPPGKCSSKAVEMPILQKALVSNTSKAAISSTPEIQKHQQRDLPAAAVLPESLQEVLPSCDLSANADRSLSRVDDDGLHFPVPTAVATEEQQISRTKRRKDKTAIIKLIFGQHMVPFVAEEWKDALMTNSVLLNSPITVSEFSWRIHEDLCDLIKNEYLKRKIDEHVVIDECRKSCEKIKLLQALMPDMYRDLHYSTVLYFTEKVLGKPLSHPFQKNELLNQLSVCYGVICRHFDLRDLAFQMFQVVMTKRAKQKHVFAHGFLLAFPDLFTSPFEFGGLLERSIVFSLLYGPLYTNSIYFKNVRQIIIEGCELVLPDWNYRQVVDSIFEEFKELEFQKVIDDGGRALVMLLLQCDWSHAGIMIQELFEILHKEWLKQKITDKILSVFFNVVVWACELTTHKQPDVASKLSLFQGFNSNLVDIESQRDVTQPLKKVISSGIVRLRQLIERGPRSDPELVAYNVEDELEHKKSALKADQALRKKYKKKKSGKRKQQSPGKTETK